MDKPAVVLTAVVGLLLIAGSIPFLLMDGGDGGQRYTITWSEVEVAEASTPFGSPSATVQLTTPAALVSNVTVGITCSEEAGTPARPATVTWTLKEGGRTLATGTAPCTPDEELDRVNITNHPDVGSTSAGSSSDAEAEAYAAGDNETRSFTLEFTYTRPAATVPNPLPVAQPTISGRMTLTAFAWHAAANEAEEATR